MSVNRQRKVILKMARPDFVNSRLLEQQQDAVNFQNTVRANRAAARRLWERNNRAAFAKEQQDLANNRARRKAALAAKVVG